MDNYLSDLKNCRLCEWHCGVDRTEGEKGVCGVDTPLVASCSLHPAPPKSYTVFMAGCNYKCLGCQNWTIAQERRSRMVRGYIMPEKLARESVRALNSREGMKIGADRIFFSGGSPTPSLPFIEEVVAEARKIDRVKVNYDTNGFMTMESFKRMLDFTTSVTFDIKAYHDEVHRALTGAPVEPVLRNAKYIAEYAKEKLWEFRILLIPSLNENEIKPLVDFLAETNPEVPVRFLAFRPNFALELHKGADAELMNKAVKIAEDAGLKDSAWSGQTGIPGRLKICEVEGYKREGAALAVGYAKKAGCPTHPRNCGTCELSLECPVRLYKPRRST